jgi:hypothetical protein
VFPDYGFVEGPCVGRACAGGSSGIPDDAGAAGAAFGGDAGELGGSSSGGGADVTMAGAMSDGGALPYELALGKSATASTQQAGNEASKGNDGDTTTRWDATSGSFPQWWRVDLGATRSLTQVSIRFEHSDRTYSYTLETSDDDKVFVTQRTASGTGAVQSVEFPPDVSARYVRVTITNGTPTSINGIGTWASFFEFSLTGL